MKERIKKIIEQHDSDLASTLIEKLIEREIEISVLKTKIDCAKETTQEAINILNGTNESK